MTIADDLAQLLPTRRVAHGERDPRPVYYLWTFDPTDGQVYLDHNEDKHPAEHITHAELAPHVTHPDKVDGYAYSIKGGWRITEFGKDASQKPVEDPFIVRRVLAALEKKEPPAPLPHIRYHGRP